MKRVLGFSFLVAVFICTLTTITSADSPSFTTSPVSFGINITPGTSQSEELEIMNNTSQAVPIVMKVETFSAYGTIGQASIEDFPDSSPAAKYITLTPSTFVAQPGVWSKVKATISLPKTAQLGFYYAVLFQPQLTVQKKATAILKSENAVLILVDTGSANEIKSISIANFSVTKNVNQFLPATFNVDVRNNGNIFLAPTGDIYISRNSNGTNTINTLPVNSGVGHVLPDSNRVFSATWANGFPVFVNKYVNGKPVLKKDVPVQQLVWNWSKVNKFRFGKYYAILALQYNNGKREVLLSSVVGFWVIPWKILIVLLVFLLLLLFGLFVIFRSIYRKIKKPATKRKQKSET